MKSPFEKKFCGKSPLKELTAKQEANLPEALKTAIEAKSPTNYGSPLEQKKSPEYVGYYNPEYEAHPSEKLPTRKENKAELDAAKFSLSKGKQARKDMIKMKSGPEKTAKAKEAYDLSKPYFEADSKMRKQKRKDYKTILKAGATIAKNM
jgi:bisphosphoglycerate-dependent phosphoglycerate mutase